MIGSRSILSLLWILSAKSVLGNDNAASAVDHDGTNRSLRAVVGGNLFGLFSKKTCRKMENGVFETISTPRFRGYFGSLFGGGGSGSDKDGACNVLCKDLCPTTCFGSFKVDGSTCSCTASKCSGNAICNGNNKCECRLGFSGNGLVCCDSSSGLNFTEAGCAFRVPAPSGNGGPIAPSAPIFIPPTPATAPVTPVAPAPRAFASGRDVLAPKLLDFAVLSPTTVDVSSANAKIDFLLSAEDDKSGISTLTLTAFTSYTSIKYTTTFSPPVIGKVIHPFSLSLPKNLRAGSAFLFIELKDFQNNTRTMGWTQLAELNYPYDIQIVNAVDDLLPPTFTGFAPLTTPTLNASSSLATKEIFFRVNVQDDFSGVRVAALTFQRPGSSDFVYVVGLPFAAAVNDFVASAADFPTAGSLSVDLYPGFQQGIRAGTYRLIEFVVSDFSGKDLKLNSTALAVQGYTQTVNVVN